MMNVPGIEVDTTNFRLIWDQAQLKEDIFQIAASLHYYFGIKMQGEPYLISKTKDIWCWDYKLG